jgi:hypothetical protein
VIAGDCSARRCLLVIAVPDGDTEFKFTPVITKTRNDNHLPKTKNCTAVLCGTTVRHCDVLIVKNALLKVRTASRRE